jgi:hypothetical protein
MWAASTRPSFTDEFHVQVVFVPPQLMMNEIHADVPSKSGLAKHFFGMGIALL